MTVATQIETARELTALRQRLAKSRDPKKISISICAGTGCVASGAFRIKEELEKEIVKRDLQDEVSVVATGCNGFCGHGPLMVIRV